jgi:hypothetical protein
MSSRKPRSIFGRRALLYDWLIAIRPPAMLTTLV